MGGVCKSHDYSFLLSTKTKLKTNILGSFQEGNMDPLGNEQEGQPKIIIYHMKNADLPAVGTLTMTKQINE